MARKLVWEEAKALQEELRKKDEYKNVFIINDIEDGKFGRDYEIYQEDTAYFLHWKGFSVVMYAPSPYDLGKVEAFLDTLSFRVLNGMGEYTDALAPYLEAKGYKANRSEMMYVDKTTFRKIPRADGCRLMLAPEDFEKMADLYATSPDFNLNLKDDYEKEDWACDMAEKEYPFASVGYFIKKKLVAACYTSAVTRRSAMVVGVYVHPDHEGKGIGTAMMSELTDLCLNENRMEYLTLFYSTPRARHVYEKLGYQPIGTHNMFKKQ